MTAATCNGITIEYEEYGSGEPLLLIMGLSGQLVAWPMDWVQRWVELGFRVIRFDNRDIGLSSKMPGEPPTIARIVRAAASRRLARSDYLLSDIADDSVGVLDHLGIDKAHVVGVSMGGMIAQCMAIDHPERVKSLTSIMSNTGDRRHGRPRASLLRKLPKVVARTPEEAVDKSVETFRLISGPHFDEVEVRHLAELALKRGFDADGAAPSGDGGPRQLRPHRRAGSA